MLKIKNINKSFSGITKPIFNDFSLNVENGEYCIILGTNGSGKSTLIKVISGEYNLNSGDISLNNRRIDNLAFHQRANLISSVDQDIVKGTVDEMTLLENIVLSQRRGANYSFNLYKKHEKDIYEQIKSLNLGLENFLMNKISLLSGGQRQAIATLMAVNPIPQLLLLDEHTSALDPKNKAEIMRFTDDHIKKYNITTLMITHNIEDALNYGNRLIIMQHGKIVFDVRNNDKSNITKNNILEILHQHEDYI